MSYVSIRAAIQGLLIDWPDAPIAWDNAKTPLSVKSAQDVGEPWVAMTILPGASITSGVGSTPCVRNTGLIEVQVFTQPNSGTIPAYTLCDSLAEALQHQQNGHFETQALSVTRSGIINGWYQLNASVSYRYG